MKMLKLFHLSLLTALLPSLYGMTAEEKEKFWFRSPEIKLSRKSNRGVSAQTVLKKVNYKIPSPRITPVAEFIKDGKRVEKGNVKYQKVSVTLKEEAGVKRTAWIRFGLPLPQGGVFQTGKIRIVDGAGREIPSQIAVTNFWKDSSIKWALVQFPMPLEANMEKVVYAEFGNDVEAKKYSGITFTEDGDIIKVNTGKITAEIDRKKFTLLRSVRRGKLHLGNFGGIIMKDDKSGVNYRMSFAPPDSFTVSEAGPLRLTFRVAGKFWDWRRRKSSMRYVARVSFYANSEAIDIQYTHINDNIDREFTDIASLNLEFVPAGGITGLKTPLTENGVERIFQETDQFYSINNGSRAAGKFAGSAVTEGKRKFTVGIADAWQRYPKALSVKNKRLSVELLPAQPDKEFNRDLPYYLVFPFCEGAYRIKWGMRFTESIRFDFAGNDVEAELNKPVIAVLPVGWYARSGVFPGIDAPGFEEIDAKILNSFRERQAQSAQQREYGYFNYGDSFGEKKVNWTNNEYDMAHGLFFTFFRTGNRDAYRAALAAARHQADVDICHAYPDPYYVGCNLSHRAVHNGRYKMWTSIFNKYQSAENGHTWVYGMINAWNVAGDASVMDAALLAGDHISLAMAPNYKMSTHAAAPRECAWAMRAAGKLYEATFDPVHLEAMKRLAMVSAENCKKFKTGIWAFKNDRVLQERNEDIYTNAIFVTAIGMKGLCEYYTLSGDESVKPFIRKIADRLLCAFSPEDGCGFAYDVDEYGRKVRYAVSTLNFSIVPPIAEAAVILNDPQLYDTAKRGMSAGLLRKPGFSGKMFAEYLSFLPDFLTAHSQFPAKYKLDFKESTMLAATLSAPHNNWCWRGPETRNYQLKLLKDGRHKVTMQRWVTSYRVKKTMDNSGITVVGPQGGKIVELPIDSSKGTLTAEFEVEGSAGDIFEISVRDTANGDWSIISSPAFIHAGIFKDGKAIRMARCGLNELFFEVEAGKDAEIEYYGTHIGAFGLWLFDENGKMLNTASGNQPANAISNAPANRINIKIPANSKRKLYSVACWADSDAKIFISNVKAVSGSPVFFK